MPVTSAFSFSHQWSARSLAPWRPSAMSFSASVRNDRISFSLSVAISPMRDLRSERVGVAALAATVDVEADAALLIDGTRREACGGGDRRRAGVLQHDEG